MPLAGAVTPPVPVRVLDVAISDNHVGTTATNEDVCAVMNGCR